MAANILQEGRHGRVRSYLRQSGCPLCAALNVNVTFSGFEILHRFSGPDHVAEDVIIESTAVRKRGAF